MCIFCVMSGGVLQKADEALHEPVVSVCLRGPLGRREAASSHGLQPKCARVAHPDGGAGVWQENISEYDVLECSVSKVKKKNSLGGNFTCYNFYGFGTLHGRRAGHYRSWSTQDVFCRLL